jgi:phage terminase small subunit
VALSSKQQAFINEYLKCWNATRAAVGAGYSERTARSIGSENLTKPDIVAEIARRKAELMMSADEALARLTEQARAAYSTYFNENGDVDIARMVADGKGHLIKGKKPTRHGDVIEFHDAQTALLNVGKHHGLFTDKTEHSGEIKITDDLTDDQRAARIAAILAKAQQRGDHGDD